MQFYVVWNGRSASFYLFVIIGSHLSNNFILISNIGDQGVEFIHSVVCLLEPGLESGFKMPLKCHILFTSRLAQTSRDIAEYQTKLFVTKMK